MDRGEEAGEESRTSGGKQAGIEQEERGGRRRHLLPAGPSSSSLPSSCSCKSHRSSGSIVPRFSTCSRMSSNVNMAEVAERLAAIINKLDTELTCGVCNRTMVDCRRVTCGHWFCLICIEETIKNRPAGQRSAECPDCGHAVVKRWLKEDDLMQVVLEKVAAAKQIVDESGLEKAGRVDDSSDSPISFSSDATSSVSEDTPPKQAKKKVVPEKQAAKPVDDSDRLRKDSEEGDSAAAGLASIDPDGLPATPDVSFDARGDRSLSLKVINSTPFTATPNSSHLSAGLRSGDRSKSRISTASINASKKKLFEKGDGLSESSSDPGDEVATCFRSSSPVIPSPAGVAADLRSETSPEYSKQSSHTSQFFEKWPYKSPAPITPAAAGQVLRQVETPSETSQKQIPGEPVNKEETETGRSEEPALGTANAGMQIMSPMPSFLAISSWTDVAEPEAKAEATVSRGTQTTTLSDRRSTVSQAELETFMHKLINPVVRETLVEVQNYLKNTSPRFTSQPDQL